MYDKNLVAEMSTVPVARIGSSSAASEPPDWLDIFNQHHQIGTWELNIGTRQMVWSAETYRIHGLDPSDGPLDLKRALSFFHPQDVSKVEQLIAQAIRLKRGYRFKLRVLRPDNTTRVVESIASVQLNPKGEVERIVGVVRDITQQVEHENTRTGQTDLLLRMVRSMPTGAALCDRNMKYIAWSPRWLIDLGMSEKEDLTGRSHYDVFPEVGADKREIYNMVLRGQTLGKDRDRIQRANGTVMILDWVMQPWQDRYGEVGGAVILTHVHFIAPPKQAQVAGPPPAVKAPQALLSDLMSAQPKNSSAA